MRDNSGLTYLRNRYYDEETGTFMTMDPIKDGMNWYAYCEGNPVNRIDPTGNVSAKTAEKRIKENASYIKSAAKEFDIDPAILASVIYTEQVKNVHYTEEVEDFILVFIGQNASVGISQVRIETAKKIEDAGYMPVTCSETITTYSFTIPFINKPVYHTDYVSRESKIYDKLMNNYTNIRYAAAYISMIQDIWKDKYPEIENDTAIVATLYNKGEYGDGGPKSNPESNEFGDFAEENYDKMRKLLE